MKNPISLLPEGSVLHGVLLPRYDEKRNLVGDLKAEIMTLVDSQRVQGENVLIKFYNPDRSLRGKVQLQNALFNQTTSQLVAKEPVVITTDRLIAKGDGLLYAFQSGKGFLIGPASTWISYSEPSTSMRPKTMNHAAALFALCFASPIAIAAPPAYVSEAELSEIQSSAASSKEQLGTQNQSAEETLKQDIENSTKASEAAHAFIKTSDLKTIATEPPPTSAPLKVEPGPNDTVIKCEGGMYFDAEEGVLVYLKNVTVADPRFNLSGADELKVFFKKKAPAPAKDPKAPEVPKKSSMAGPTANFGDVQKLIATGTVRLLQKSVGGKEPVEASGGLLTYDVPKGEIIISQRYPWVKQGSFYARAKQPNLTLRLLNDGSFSTQGNWEMGGNLNLKGR